MKLFAYTALSFVLLLSACSGSSEEKDKKTAEKDSKKTDEPFKDRVGEYRKYVEGLSTTNAESATLAMKKYKELFKDADVQTCDSAFIIFNDFYEIALLGNLNEAVYKDEVLQNTEYYMTDEDGNELPLPKPFKDLENKVSKHGYRLEFPEGMISIGMERKFIEKNFYNFVSPDMQVFLTRLDHDNNDPLSADGGIIVSEAEFVERMIWWENFAKKHPDFILKDRVKATEQQLFSAFLMGGDNTPVYWTNEENGAVLEMTDYFKTVYAILEKRYPKSEAWKRIKPYQKAILANDMKTVEKLRKDYQKKGYTFDYTKEDAMYYVY